MQAELHIKKLINYIRKLKNNMKIIFPEIFPVACHTKNIGPSSTFVAIKGMQEDGSKYILDAISKGASKIVIDKNIELDLSLLNLISSSSIELVKVDNPRKSLAELSAEAYGYPAKKLKIIGITGTKGKSTTAFLIHDILTKSGFKTALLSTVKNKILNEIMPRSLTTEQPDYLHAFFDLCLKSNIDYVVMEVAAQAFSLYRVHETHFDIAIFTNFALEHGEFYPSLDDYFSSKMQIFKHLKHNAQIYVNSELKDKIDQMGTYCYKTFGLGSSADVLVKVISNNISGLVCEVDGISENFVSSSLLGEFNAYNIVAAYCAVKNIVPLESILSSIKTFQGVPGRLNFTKLPNGASAVIDYAHNPSSFEAVLFALKNLSLDNNLIVVFGAGGERDSSKRPLMGKIASDYADTIILTSDNPRSENAYNIANDIKFGISNDSKVIIEIDRELAIKYAYSISDSKSIIVLLGKGPDEYQIINGIKTYFSESQILDNL